MILVALGVTTVRAIISPSHTFPAAPSSNVYKANVPSGVTYLGTLGGDIYNKVQSNTAYWVDENVNYNMDFGRVQNITLYVKGTVKPSNLALRGSCTIYLTKGATLTFDNEYSFENAKNTTIYVAENGTLRGSSSKKLQLYNTTLYNAGHITGSRIELSSNSLLYNQNGVTVTGDIIIDEGGGDFINSGDMNLGGKLQLQGSGHFRNDGTATVKDKTIISGHSNTWQNKGCYTSSNWYYQDGSPDIINNNSLIVGNNLCISGCSGNNAYKMDDNSSTVCKNLYVGGTIANQLASGDVKIEMGDDALFNVTETAIMNIGEQSNVTGNTDTGIYGLSSNNHATFQAKIITHGSTNNDVKHAKYGGMLKVIATRGHYPLWADSDGNANYEFLDGFTLDDLTVGTEPLQLDNTSDNTNAISEWDGLLSAALLANRTLYKDGKWNTLCLPFDVTMGSGQMEGATAMTMNASQSGFNASTGELTLYFDGVDEGKAIKAGTPFIVKWSGTDLTSPIFSSVTVSSTEAGSVMSQDGKVQFVGCYSPDAITVGNKATIYLGAENKLYWPSGTNYDKFPGLAGADDAHFYLGACRAYFKVDLGGGLGVWPAPASVRAFNLNFGDGSEETGILSFSKESGNQGNNPEFLNSLDYYTLDGQRLDGKPTRKGLYIHGGRKVVIP